MDFEKISKYVDENEDSFVEKLRQWVAFKTVSALPECRPECFKFVDHVKKELEELDVKVTIVPNPAGKQHFPSGEVVDFPPFILAEKIKDPSKKTLCIYGHLDVQPALKEDGWDTEPFELSVSGDVMLGRGSTDDKGPVLGWLCVLKAMKDLGLDLDLNLKFIFESMEESGSDGLTMLVEQEKSLFLKDVDFVCISDNYWLGTDHPCITYGLRGLMYYYLEVSGPKMDLHSGVYGGTVREPMIDCITLMGKLVDGVGNILIPSACDEVAPVEESEIKLYEKIDFNLESYVKGIGCEMKHLLYPTKEQSLMHRWRYPTLSLHGIEGAFSGMGTKTVIPAKVIGKFSMRMVPNMTPDHVDKCVRQYVNTLAKELNTPNKITLSLINSSPAWVSDYTNPNYTAAIKATKQVYGVDPDLTREGGSIPVALDFEQLLGKNVVLLPMGRGDDGAHSQNEKLNKSNFTKGIKLFYAYLKEMSNSQ